MIHLGYSFSSATDESVGSGSVDYTEEYSSDEFDESPHESFSLDPTLVRAGRTKEKSTKNWQRFGLTLKSLLARCFRFLKFDPQSDWNLLESHA